MYELTIDEAKQSLEALEEIHYWIKPYRDVVRNLRPMDPRQAQLELMSNALEGHIQAMEYQQTHIDEYGEPLYTLEQSDAIRNTRAKAEAKALLEVEAPEAS